MRIETGRIVRGVTAAGRVAVLLSVIVLITTAAAGQRVAAQDLVISEFLALNSRTLADEDGDFSDWIEVHNPGVDDVRLRGWSLTDSPDDRRWTFPDVVLEAGGFLVVFASGKDRSVAGAELHTSFNLRGDGEYLALLRADGSIAHEFRPAYPRQVEDFSYGMATEVAELAGADSALDYLVPEDGSLGDSWTEPGFVTGGAWRSGTGGLGFHEGGSAEVPAPLSHWPLDGGTADAVGPNDGSYEGPANPTWVEGFDGRSGGAIRFDGSDYIDVLTIDGLPAYNEPAYTIAMWVKGLPQNDRRVYSEGSSTNNSPLLTIGTDASGNTGRLDIFLRTDTGTTLLPHRLSNAVAFDDTWHHIAWVDENGAARVYIDGVLDTQDFSYPKQPLSLDISSIGSVLRSSACCHFTGAIDDIAVWHRALSGAEVAVLAAGASPAAGSSYAGHIRTDVAAPLKDRNASIFVRLPFDIGDPTAVGSLTLRLRYDDGFIAWLNGTEAARANAPAPAGWNSAATSEHSGADAVSAESFNLSAWAGALVPGRNVLALQGLNLMADDPTFLLAAELLATGAIGSRFRYFVDPTPGAPNRGGTVDFVADTKFSVDRGFYRDPFTVEITTATEGAEIRYTLDGTAPTATRGAVYTGPIPVGRTTTLRAAAFREGWQPTNVDTHTYIFLDDVIRQPNNPPGYPSTWAGLPADYAMDPEICTDTGSPHYEPTIREDLQSIPTLSIVMDPGDFVGPTRGIYTHPLNRGLAWERPASAELIIPEALAEEGTDRGFQVNCGIRMQGGSSARPIEGKHSFRLLFKSVYGPSKLRYRWFEDSPVDEIDGVVLRCFSTDAWAFKDGGSRYRRWDSQYIRDLWMKDSQLAMGHLSGHNTYVHLYVNGLYWGLYNPSERPDDSFHSLHQGDEKEDWDIVKDFNELFRGNRRSWDQLFSLANAGLGSLAAYQRIQGNNPDGTPNPLFPDLLDVDNLIDYMLLHIYGCAEDWPHHNWYAARSRTGNLGGWRFFVWDQEIVMDFVFRNRVGVSNDNSPARLYSQLRANPEFRLRFADRVEKHLFHGGALSVEKARERWMRRAREIDRAIVGESARWGDFREDIPDPSRSPATLYTREEHWLPERDRVLNDYIPESNRLAFERLRSAGLYPRVDPPILSRHGGAIARGFRVGVAAPAGVAYYTLDGSDPRLTGGGVSPRARMAGTAASVTLLTAPSAAKVLVPSGPELGLDWTDADFDDAAWADATVGIGYERTTGYEDEIATDVESLMYDTNPSIYIRVPFVIDDPSAFSFLSLSMKYDDGYVAWINGVEVLSRNAPDPIEWDSRAGGSHADPAAVVFETFDITERIGALRAGTNVLAIQGLNASVTSSDFLIVPELGAGSVTETGVVLDETTLVRARALLGNDWSALVEATFFIDEPLDLRITELMYHPPRPLGESPWNDDDFEFVELQNVGSRRLALTAVRFTDGITFDFSGADITRLDPGEVVVVVKDREAFESRYGPGLPVAGEYTGNLENFGETLRLEDPFAEPVLEFQYLDTWHPATDGRGLSLEIVDVFAPAASWKEASSWRPSAAVLGTPGFHPFQPPDGGLQLPGDINQDAGLDISDPIRMLRFLFLGEPFAFPCAGANETSGGNLLLFDLNGDRGVDLSDPVYTLNFLFTGGPPPVLGTGCMRIEGCPDACVR